MKILLLGASGMTGHLIATYLKEKHFDLYTLTHHEPFDSSTLFMDVRDFKTFKNFLDRHDFQVIINCIGLNPKASEQNPTEALLLNTELPLFLAENYLHTSTRIIHLSTLQVFADDDGTYREKSPCNNQLVYGHTKALGELNNYKDITLRTSLIGPETSLDSGNLFHQFMQLKGPYHASVNPTWNGITTLVLAQAIEDIILDPINGIYHLVSNDCISEYELLLLMKEVFFKNEITLLPKQKASATHHVLNTRFDFAYMVPSYPEMLHELKDWILNHPKLYPHYLSL